MAAHKHWSGFSKQDRTPPPVHFMLNIALVSTVWLCQSRRCHHPLPFFQTGSRVTHGFSLPFHSVYLDFLISFLLVTEVPLWCNSTQFWEHYSNNRRWPVWSPTSWAMHSFPTAVSYFGTPRHAGRLIFRVECKTTLQPAYRQHTLLHVSAKTHLLLTLATWAWER